MNDDLSSVIEHALLYASPLPVTTAAEHMRTFDGGGTVTGPFVDHAVSSNSDSAILSLLENAQLQVLNTVPVCNNTSGEVTAGAINDDQVTNSDEMAESVIEKLISKTLHFQSTAFVATKYPNLSMENDSWSANSATFVSSSENINLTQNEALVAPILLNLVQTNTESTPMSPPVPPDTTMDVAESSEVSDSSQEKNCNQPVKSPSKSPEPQPKKKRKREKNPLPRPEPFLPFCSICNEKSSGFHYGANTCEACKAFFRRTQKTQKVRFKCKCKPDEVGEWKRGPIKNGCAACRYERCLMVGMSKDAIKIGRYTLNHKTKNINEIKSVVSTDVATSPASESSPSSTIGSEIGVSSPENNSSAGTVQRPEVTTSSSLASRDMHGECRDSTTENPVLSLEEIDSIVKILTEAQTRVPFIENFQVPLEVIKQKQTEYLEKYKLRTELFGDMGLSKEESTEFYNITGIDLDGRIQHLENAFQFFEKKISLVVAFAKSIPGFRTLKLDDQANLIKASRIENMVLGGYKDIVRNFDFEKQVVTTPWGKEIHMDELARLIPIDFLFMKFKFARLIVDLSLTVEEESVIRAIVTMFSDRCKVEESKKVEQIQEKLVACLQHVLSTRPGGPGTLLYKIFNLMIMLRDFTENETQFAKQMLGELPVSCANKYQLLKEFLT